MGQLALGFRSLLIRLAVFFVMALLLAWALGGTLWPRTERVDGDAVRFDGRTWNWRLSVGSHQEIGAYFQMMVTGEEARAVPLDERQWLEVAVPVVTGDALFFAGRAAGNQQQAWRIERVDETGGPVLAVLLPDRLAVERQLARLREGLPLQSADEVRLQRPRVLEPGGEVAEAGPGAGAGAGAGGAEAGADLETEPARRPGRAG